MAPGDLELVKWLVEAWNSRDLTGFASKLRPDVDWVPGVIARAEAGAASEFRGTDGFWRWVAATEDIMDEYRIDAESFRDLGDGRVLVLGALVVKGRSSGAEVRTELGQLLTIRNEQVSAYRGYLDRAEALEAAGLREPETRP